MTKPSDSQDFDTRLRDLKKRYSDDDDIPIRPRNEGMGVGMRMATDMVAGVLVGLFIGYNLDVFFATKPLFLLIFMIIGMVSGIVNVIRTAKRLEHDK